MCGIIMSGKERVYISLYFSDGLAEKRKKRDLTLAFDPNDELYRLCKRLGPSRIKEIIGLDSYTELVEKARLEERPLGNYIKHKLRAFLEHGEKGTSC